MVRADLTVRMRCARRRILERPENARFGQCLIVFDKEQVHHQQISECFGIASLWIAIAIECGCKSFNSAVHG